MMGDDAMIVSTEDHPKARAVYQSLRLFPDSIAQVIGRDAKRSPVADYIEKWNIEFSDTHSAEEPLPIRAIFLLDTQVTTEISLERVDGAAAAFALLEQSFALDPIDAAMASDRLRQASVIAQQIPFFALAYPRNYGDLAAVHEVIVNAASAGRALAE
jgi:hypothetical protein